MDNNPPIIPDSTNEFVLYETSLVNKVAYDNGRRHFVIKKKYNVRGKYDTNI